MTIEVGTGRPDEYLHDGKPVPSVTTVLPDRGDNDGLLTWAGREAIKAAYRAQLSEQEIERNSGRFWACAKAHTDTRQTAADQGSAMHAAIQAHIIGDQEAIRAALWAAPDPECVEVCLEAYRAWEADLGACIEWTAIEVPLVNRWLAGTPDMWGRITYPDGREGWVVGDLKSGKYVSKKVGKQLGLYRYLLRDVRGLEMSDAVILHLHASRKDGEIVVKKSTPRFGGKVLDQYERAGRKELAAFYADLECMKLPGMWA